MSSQKVSLQVSQFRNRYKNWRKDGLTHSAIVLANPEIEEGALLILQQEFDGEAGPPVDRDISKSETARSSRIGKPMAPKESKPTFGNWLAWTRYHKELTRPALATMMKIKLGDLIEIETDRRPPSPHEILKIEQTLGCNVPTMYLKDHLKFNAPISA